MQVIEYRRETLFCRSELAKVSPGGRREMREGIRRPLVEARRDTRFTRPFDRGSVSAAEFGVCLGAPGEQSQQHFVVALTHCHFLVI